MDKILIEWEVKDTYRVALSPEDAEEMFGTTNRDVIMSRFRANINSIRSHLQEEASGEGSLERLDVRDGWAEERKEGLFYLNEGDSRTGPFESADEAFGHWEQNG